MADHDGVVVLGSEFYSNLSEFYKLEAVDKVKITSEALNEIYLNQ